MKVGDVIKFKRRTHHKGAFGTIVIDEKESNGRGWGIMWNFLDGRIGWNHSWMLEVIDG